MEIYLSDHATHYTVTPKIGLQLSTSYVVHKQIRVVSSN